MNTILHDSTTVPPITCPDWCTTNHDRDPFGGHDGPSWPDIPGVSARPGVSIGSGHCDEHGVIVYLDALSVALTPEQARQAGLALLSAASWAKDHQCGTTGTDHGDWNGQFKSGQVVAILCPACQTPEQNAEAEINAATIEYGTDTFGHAVARPKANMPHLTTPEQLATFEALLPETRQLILRLLDSPTEADHAELAALPGGSNLAKWLLTLPAFVNASDEDGAEED